MTNYFDLMSVIMGLLSIQTLMQLYQNWSKFWDSHVTPQDQELAQRIALFILIPIGVLFHEIGHSLATWQVGGTVETFQWRLYWGFIIPSGNFSPAESWWISFSGNLVSIVLGLLPIPFIPLIRRRIIGELLYSFACVEAIYSLIFYPIFSFTAQRGDWLRIYDFSIQPYATITLVLHIGLLGALWQLYGSQAALRWRLARTPNVFQAWQTLKRDVEDNPKSLQTHLELAYFLLQHNEVRDAKTVAKKMEAIAPNSEQRQVFQVAMLYTKKSYGKAIQLGKTLLTVNLSSEEQLRLYQILCMSLYQMNRLSEALSYASQGLENASNDWRLRYHRAIVYRMLNQEQDALADLEVAIEYAPDEDVRQQLQDLVLQISERIKQRPE